MMITMPTMLTVDLATARTLFLLNKGRLARVLTALFKYLPHGVILLVLAYCAYKYHKNKRIQVHCKDTKMNRAILAILKEKIAAYSPTFYLPSVYSKVLLGATREMKFLDCYMRMEVTASDGELIPLDWYPRNYRKLADDTPIVMFIPGVFGTSRDYYSITFCKKVYEVLGWRCFIMNRRLFLSQLKAKKLVAYTSMTDWRESIDHVREVFPQADIYLIGVSMGALHVQKYLIEYQSDPRVVGAVAISSPYNAGVSSYQIRDNPLLRKVMHTTMVHMFRHHLHHEEFVDLCIEKGIDIEKVVSSKDNFEFDTYMSIRDLELDHPDQYYDMMSSHLHMNCISVPLLCINSEDDPLIPATSVPLNSILENEKIIQVMVAGGGHIEYFSGPYMDWWGFDLAIKYLHNIKRLTRSHSELNPRKDRA